MFAFLQKVIANTVRASERKDRQEDTCALSCRPEHAGHEKIECVSSKGTQPGVRTALSLCTLTDQQETCVQIFHYKR